MMQSRKEYSVGRYRVSFHGNLLIKILVVALVLFSGLLVVAPAGSAAEDKLASGVFNVRDYGAVGDGVALDTAALNQAVEACAAAGGGQVRFPPGRYLSGTVHLKSRVTLFFEAGATLVGSTNLGEYQHPIPPSFLPEARWGKWHRGLIVGENVEDITLAGSGVIDGNRVFDPTGEECMRGPHTIVFVNCRRFVIRDISIVDSANYAIFFQLSDEVEVRNVKFTGGWDGVHFRGGKDRPCRNVRVMGCQFFTGDDSIAGRYWENVLISDCVVNSSCNGIRLIGPATHLIIHDCLFYGPGLHPHRTSNRYNMLAGVNLQPGAWDATEGNLDDVLISDVTMHNVSTPFHFSLKPGNQAGNILVHRVTATGVYRAACSVESWAETPFTNVVFRDVTIEYKGGGTPDQGSSTVKSPGVDARPLPAWGFYARNVQNLVFDQVRLRCELDDLRPVLICDGVARLTMEDLKIPFLDNRPETMVLNKVGSVAADQASVRVVQPRCTALTLSADGTTGTVRAGQPYAARVAVENQDPEGLGKVELVVAGHIATRWVWVKPREKKEIVFGGLTAPAAGTHEARCGNLSQSFRVEP
jgi:hypothetical protein